MPAESTADRLFTQMPYIERGLALTLGHHHTRIIAQDHHVTKPVFQLIIGQGVPAQGPTASPSRFKTRMMLKARSRIASGFSSISGLRTLPARGILTWEKSGASPGRHLAREHAGIVRHHHSCGYPRNWLATGLGNLQNVERENIGLVPCVSEIYRRRCWSHLPTLFLPCDMAPISSFGTIRFQGGTGSK